MGAFASLALAGATLAFTGPTNGSFEGGSYVDNGFGFRQLDAPNTSIDDWSVDAGSVDWISGYWPAPDGSKSIDMSGSDAGTLSQTFGTTIGNTYTVTFLLSGNPAGLPVVKTLDVSATGAPSGTYSHDTTGSDLGSMVWTPETYSFLATSASTTLSFISTTSGAYGPAIDNVAVTEMMPTKNDCKEGGWQTMIDNAGNRFKNHGDCVSYFATKGKNPGALPPAETIVAANAGGDRGARDKSSDSATVKPTDKATAKGERHSAKGKAKSHDRHGHGSGSHKPK
jgi:choice-of-anchor C domain-containing protein